MEQTKQRVERGEKEEKEGRKSRVIASLAWKAKSVGKKGKQVSYYFNRMHKN